VGSENCSRFLFFFPSRGSRSDFFSLEQRVLLFSVSPSKIILFLLFQVLRFFSPLARQGIRFEITTTTSSAELENLSPFYERMEGSGLLVAFFLSPLSTRRKKAYPSDLPSLLMIARVSPFLSRRASLSGMARGLAPALFFFFPPA